MACSVMLEISYIRRFAPLTTLVAALAFLGACAEERLHPDDVEYRKDENGSELLYKIGEDMPFGNGERAFVYEYHPKSGSFIEKTFSTRKKHFEVGFLNGLRDGNFTFWQKNGIKLLTGSYSKGLRNGTFTFYGKTGELVYEKNFSNGELDGNFTLYYPASNNDLLRYNEKLAEEDKDPGELTVKNHLRLQVKFQDGNPVGSYRAYYHPGSRSLSEEELLKEEGNFSDSGLLQEDQLSYYPKTHSLVVVLPDKKRPYPPHPPTPNGFSRAIDEAAKAILAIPKYRNPDNSPAEVYTLDEQGNEIVPIWSSHISRIAIRNETGYLEDVKFEPNYESYGEAEKYAIEMGGFPLEVVGLDKKGEIIDVLWAGGQHSEAIPLPERIKVRRVKVRRSWKKGYASEALWLLTNGSKISIREDVLR